MDVAKPFPSPRQGRENAVEIPARCCSHNSIQLYPPRVHASHVIFPMKQPSPCVPRSWSPLNSNLSIYIYTHTHVYNKIYSTSERVYKSVKEVVVALLAKLSYFFF